MELIFPNVWGELKSDAGRPNWAWLKRLKISARKSSPVFSQGRAKRLMTEKSVLTKSGPFTGVRLAFPSSPGTAGRPGAPEPGATKQLVLNHSPRFWWNPLVGLQIWSGRMKLLPLFWKLTPEPLLPFTINMGKPELMCSITVICQPPRIVLVGLFQLLPK